MGKEESLGHAKESLRTKLNLKNDTNELEEFLHQVLSAPYNTSKALHIHMYSYTQERPGVPLAVKG